MANEKDLKKEEISKAIDALVEEQLGKETSTAAETTAKAMPASLPENGGKDEIKSGSPYMEKKEADAKKKEMKKAEDEKSETEDVEKAKKEKEDEKKDEAKESKEHEKKEMKMKKAQEVLGDLDDEEIELVKAWREEKAKEAEEVTKSMTDSMDHEVLAKAVSDAITKAVEPLKKALEDKEAKIGDLEKSLKKLASQPAYDKRSISSLETIEKSGSEPEISKSQVLDKMLELQMKGKGVRSNHIAEFEATGNISDQSIKTMVLESFK